MHNINRRHLKVYQQDHGPTKMHGMFTVTVNNDLKVKDNYGGVYDVRELPLRKPEKYRNIGDQPGQFTNVLGHPANVLDDITPSTITGRIIKADTFIDGIPKGAALTTQRLDKESNLNQIESFLKQSEQEIIRLQNLVEEAENKGYDDDVKSYGDMILSIQKQQNEVQMKINPNYKMERGIDELVRLFGSIGSRPSGKVFASSSGPVGIPSPLKIHIPPPSPTSPPPFDSGDAGRMIKDRIDALRDDEKKIISLFKYNEKIDSILASGDAEQDKLNQLSDIDNESEAFSTILTNARGIDPMLGPSGEVYQILIDGGRSISEKNVQINLLVKMIDEARKIDPFNIDADIKNIMNSKKSIEDRIEEITDLPNINASKSYKKFKMSSKDINEFSSKIVSDDVTISYLKSVNKYVDLGPDLAEILKDEKDQNTKMLSSAKLAFSMIKDSDDEKFAKIKQYLLALSAGKKNIQKKDIRSAFSMQGYSINEKSFLEK